jgi:alpha-mannosidase
VPAAQLVGPWRFAFALLPHAGSWEGAGVLAASEAYHHPFLTMDGPARAAEAPAPSPAVADHRIRLSGDGVVLSALRRRDDWLEIRLVAKHPAPTMAVLAASASFEAAREVDLLGRVGADLPVERDGSIRVALGAWEIRTVQVRPGTKS